MKPIVSKTVSSFDKNIGTTIPFTWNGIQLKSNTIYFYDNSTNKLAYSHSEDSSEKFIVVPDDNDLVNGKTYSVQIKVTDINNQDSELSDKILIKCFTTPSFVIGNIAEGQTFNTTTLEFYINYSQPEGDELNNFNFNLYNSNKHLIATSETFYSPSDVYRVYGLENGTYYIRAIGQTLNRINLDTGYISFLIYCESTPPSTTFNSVNVYEKGGINLVSNIIVYNYESSGTKFTEYGLDARKGYVNYNEGLKIDGDFAMKATLKSPNKFSKIISLSNDNGDEVSVRYMLSSLESNAKGYFLLEIKDGKTGIINNCCTKMFTALNTNREANLVFKRVHNLYSIQAEIGGVLY